MRRPQHFHHALGGKSIYGGAARHPDLEASLPAHRGRHVGNGTPGRSLCCPRRGAALSPERVLLQCHMGLLPDFIAAAQTWSISVAGAHDNCGRPVDSAQEEIAGPACRRPPWSV